MSTSGPDISEVDSQAEAPSLWTLNFAGILFSNCLVFISFQMLIPILPLYVSHIGGNEAMAGLVVGGLTPAILLVRPLAGWLVDQHGRRMVMVSAISIFAVVGLAYPFTASVLGLCFIRLLQGIGWSGVSPSVGATVTDLVPKSKLGEGLAYQSTSQSLAMAIGPAIGLLFLGALNFSATFLIASSLAFIALVPALRVRHRYIPPKEKRPFRIRDLIERASIAPSVITGLTTFLFGGLNTFVPLATLDQDLGNPATFFVTFAVILVVTRPIAGRLSDRVQRRGLLLFPGLGTISLSLLVLAFTESPWTLVAAGVLWALGFGFTQPILRMMAIGRADDHRKGAANATVSTAYEVGRGGGALLLGVVASQVGIPTMFALAAFVPLVAVAYSLKWRLHSY